MMTPHFLRSRFPLVLVSSLLALPGAIKAAPVVNGVADTTADTAAFASDVATTDLLNGNGGAESGVAWQSGGGTASRLTNGLHGTSYTANNGDALANIAWANPGSIVTFDLGTGANGAGYDIKSIRSIADWVDAGFGNQGYTLEVQPVGGSFTTLATVAYSPLGGGGFSTKVTITDDGSGPGGNLASGIQFLRFTHNSVPGSVAGRITYRELDVFGTDTTIGPDLTPPVVTSLNPPDNTNNVAPTGSLVMTFNENIAIATGNITLTDLDAPSMTTIAVTDASQISVSGAVLTINPASPLASSANYSVWVDSTAVTDSSGNPYAGIADDSTWNFTTQSLPSEQFSTTQFTYAGDVSTSDLLHGLTPATTGWNLGNEAHPNELTDGIHGADFGVVPGDRVQGAWTTVGATAEYDLGSGPNSAGYTITSIQSIADWSGAGFGNQAWTIELKPAGGSYSNLATVDYQPLGPDGGTTKVTLTSPGGTLATNIQFIKVTANSQSGHTSSAFVWRELDVFGGPSDPETDPPVVVNFNPADNTNEVAPTASLVVTFDENVAVGTGNITLKDLAAPSQTIIPVGDAQVSIAGTTVTIHPASNLAASTNYSVWIDSGAITDISGNPFAGIADDSTWNFTTGAPDLTAPLLLTLSPADDATNVPLASNLVMTFDEEIAIGAGSITIKDLDTPSQTTIAVTDAQVSIWGSTLTINPASNLAEVTNYSVWIDSGSVTDIAGNDFPGINDDTSWNFLTATTPLRIMCLGDSITVGYTDNPSWANHPFMFGYRSGLYTRLTDADYNFLFVGTSTEPWTGISGDPTNGGTYTPALDLRDFGQDGHRGYGGAGIWGNVNAWIDADDPDIILLLIGINGIGGGSPAALNTLVNNIVTHAPDVHLIVAQITPRSTFNQSLYDYNLYIRDTLAPTYAGNGDKVSTVDLYSFFLDDPTTYTTIPSATGSVKAGVLSNNINHPDNPHYDLMAQEWFKGIEALGLGPNTFNSYISNPAFNLAPEDQGFNDDPDGDDLPNGLEAWFGTDPGTFNAGLTNLATDGTTTTFTHPQNPDAPTDVTGHFYDWSSDLDTWYASGDGPSGGPTVTISANTLGMTTTVTATASTALPELYLRVRVTQE